MLVLVARKNITLSTDKGDFKLNNRQILNVLSSIPVKMFDSNYLQITFKSGASKRTFHLLASEFTKIFS